MSLLLLSLSPTADVKFNSAKVYKVSLSPPACTCSDFEQTGKYCSHLFGAQWYATNGPIDQFLQGQQSSSHLFMAYPPPLIDI